MEDREKTRNKSNVGGALTSSLQGEDRSLVESGSFQFDVNTSSMQRFEKKTDVGAVFLMPTVSRLITNQQQTSTTLQVDEQNAQQTDSQKLF